MNGKSINSGTRDWFGSWAISTQSTCEIQNQKVAAYIDEHGKWKQREIRKDFLPFEAEEILATVVNARGGEDIRF